MCVFDHYKGPKDDRGSHQGQWRTSKIYTAYFGKLSFVGSRGVSIFCLTASEVSLRRVFGFHGSFNYEYSHDLGPAIVRFCILPYSMCKKKQFSSAAWKNVKYYPMWQPSTRQSIGSSYTVLHKVAEACCDARHEYQGAAKVQKWGESPSIRDIGTAVG
jgi:hypothetical protein